MTLQKPKHVASNKNCCICWCFLFALKLTLYDSRASPLTACALNRSKQLQAANEIEGFPIRKCNSVYIQTFS